MPSSFRRNLPSPCLVFRLHGTGLTFISLSVSQCIHGIPSEGEDLLFVDLESYLKHYRSTQESGQIEVSFLAQASTRTKYGISASSFAVFQFPSTKTSDQAQVN